MPFGLCHALGTFQHTMDVNISTTRWKFAHVYSDDILIFSRSPQAHIGHVHNKLKLLYSAGETFKLKKSQFLTEKINYLGHIIRFRGLEIASYTKNAINGLQPPANPTERHSFPRLCNAFKRFVQNFARMAAPLNAKLRKDRPKVFGPVYDEELKSMILLKDALISPPVLELLNSIGLIILDTEVCNIQGECVLLHTTTQQNPLDIRHDH